MRYDERLDHLELLVGQLDDRVARLEAAEARTASVSDAARPATPPADTPRSLGPAAPRAGRVPPRREPPPAAPPPRSLDLEELLGGRVLAWVGGLTVLLGIVFFLATAIR